MTSQEALGEIVRYIQSNSSTPEFWVYTALIVAVTVVVWNFVLRDRHAGKVIDLDAPIPCGDITKETLRKYDGLDPFLPIYFSVRGKVYDVTKGRDFYGPGGGYHVFAGKEVARALAIMSLEEKDCTGDLDDLTEKQLQTLQEWENKFASKYGVVGQVVPAKELTLEQLAEYDGTNDKPIYLSIKGTIFDVTKGRDYYGPDGVYPFGGKECARALAKYSTDVSECNDDLEGLEAMELDMLRDWEARFNHKYPIVGRIVGK